MTVIEEDLYRELWSSLASVHDVDAAFERLGERYGSIRSVTIAHAS